MMSRRVALWPRLLVCALLATRAIADPMSTKVIYHIPAQDAAAALMTFAEASDLRFLAASGDLSGVRTNALVGEYVPADAIRILLDGTGLKAVLSSDGTLTVTRGHSRVDSAAPLGPAPLKPAAASGGRGELPLQAIEEIVVTARKRVESIQDAPLSVQAFSAEQLEQQGTRSLADLSKFAPGLNLNSGSSRAASDFSIRGMTQISPVGDNRRDLVTVFVDGVPYIGNPSGVGTEDLARVEVIKGPQSALFGRATFGGAISLLTTTPGNEPRGRVSATAASYGDFRLQGSIEGPLLRDKVAARLMVEGSTFDGFYRNALGGRLGESERRYAAGTVLVTPRDDVSIRLRYSNRHDEDGPAATTLIARAPDHNCGPFPGFTPRPLTGLPPGFTLAQSRRLYCGALRVPTGPIGINTSLPATTLPLIPLKEHRLDLDHELASVAADWKFGGGYTATAIASTQEQNIEAVRDFELAPEDRYQVYTTNDQTQDTYEVRLTSPATGRVDWMLGVARLETTYQSLGAFINGALFGTAGPATPAAASLVPLRSASRADSLFGSVGIDVTDDLNVSLEARRQQDIQRSGVGSSNEFSVATTATLPRLIVRRALDDETNMYANYAKGNQPTLGYATYFLLTAAQQAAASANGVNPSAPEATVENFEIGIKHREDDGRWYLSAAAYYLAWTGRQGVRTIQVDLDGDGVVTTLPAPAGETFNAVPFAAGDSHTRGVELDGAFRLREKWTVGASAAYADTEITKALNEAIPLRFLGITDARGYEYPLAPELSAAAYARFDSALSGVRTWFARADVTYIGKRYDSLMNLAWVPAQLRANLRAGMRGERWEFTAFVNNVFDDDTLEASRFQSDSATDPVVLQMASSEAVLPHRRQFGLTTSFRF